MIGPLSLVRVADTETTGLDPEVDELVEVGWVDLRVHHDGLHMEGLPHQMLVNPGRSIPWNVRAIHHISDKDVAGAISAAEARRIVTTGADVLAFHNAAFDTKFITVDHKFPVICTYRVARHIWPELETHSNQALRYYLNLLTEEPEFSMTMPPHRAAPDAFVTAHLLIAMTQHVSLEEMVEISKRKPMLLKMPFGKHKGERFSNLPFDYLDWIINKSDMANDPSSDVVATARAELKRRAVA